MTAKDLRDQAAYFSLKPEEMRAAATTMKDANCRAIILQLADAYDERADLLGGQLRPIP